MGELIPFKKPHEGRCFAKVELSQGVLMDFIDGEKVRAGTHDGHAICGSDGKILRLIATEPGELLSEETIQEILGYYSSGDNQASYIPNPSEALVREHQIELGFFLET